MIPTLQLGGLGRASIRAAAALTDAPFVSVSRSTALSTTTATVTAIPYDAEVEDSDGFWASSPNPERLIIPTGLDGWYFFSGQHKIPSTHDATNNVTAIIRFGAAGAHSMRLYPLVSPFIEETRNIAFAGYLAATDYAQFDWRHRSSGIISLVAGATAAMVRLSPTSPIGAHAYNSGSTSCSSGSSTRLAYATEVRDDGGMYDASAAYRLTVPSGGAGWYVMAGTFYIPSASGGVRAYLQVNGATVARQSFANGGSDAAGICASSVRYLADGEYVELYCDQNSGGALNATDARLVAARVAAVTYGGAVRRTTSQSLSGVDEAAISFDTEDRDDGGYYDSGSPTRITVPTGKGGRHIITGTGQFSGSTGGERMLIIRKNGSTDLQAQEIYPFAGHNDPHMCVATTVDLADGDYVELRARDVSANTSFSSAYFAAVRVPA